LITSALWLATASCLFAVGRPRPVTAEEKFVVVGERLTVRKPGKIRWTPDLTLLTALSAAGGFGGFEPRTVYIIRGTEKIAVRLKQIMKRPETDPKLQPGDHIESGE
jgi:protein involved in polysaccharide export with SLBB domain